MITAKAICTSKTESGDGEDRQVAVRFRADYDDDRNKQWARYTPALDLCMTLRGAIADRFAAGQAFTLTFEPEG